MRYGPGDEAQACGDFADSEPNPRANKDKEIDECITDRLNRAPPHQAAMTADPVFLGAGSPKVFLPLKPPLVPVSISLNGSSLGLKPTLMTCQIFLST